MNTKPDLIFYAHVPGARVPTIIDNVVLDAHGVQRSRLLGDTLEQVRARWPGADICTLEEFAEHQEDAVRTAPMSIGRKEFLDALYILPPVGWQDLGSVECFRMSERQFGRMTSIYVRVKDTYWTFIDRHDIPLQEIMAKIEAKLREMVPA